MLLTDTCSCICDAGVQPKEVIEGYLCISVKNGLMQVAALVL